MKKFRLIFIIGIAIIGFIAAAYLGLYSPDKPLKSEYNTATSENGWNLILINKDNLVPDDYEFELLQLSNGVKVDERIYPDLQRMFDDARAEGFDLFVAQGYRTAEQQQRLFDSKENAYRNEGKSPEEAKELAGQWVAAPGASEHQIGIAVDINANTEKNKPEDVYAWLADNAHKYGFIKRYPADKTDITGIINEPWHYRYVGIEAAKEIYENNLCLEEYIESIN